MLYIFIAIMGLMLIVWQLVLLPYLRLQARRRMSSQHQPIENEIWLQDGALIYIAEVRESGLDLISYDGKRAQRWTETWATWRERLQRTTIFFTGQMRQLDM